MQNNVNVGNSHYRIVIVGGGTAGITTASLLRRAGEQSIAIIEPSRQHFYQPIWTLVGGGAVRRESSVRWEADYIPRGVDWIQEIVTEIDPERQKITIKSGKRISYDFLVVAAGIELNWDSIPGMVEAIERGDASTNYTFDLAPKTWDLIRNFRGGNALFHMPAGPVKCPGAPQKIMYLAGDYFRRKGILKDTNIIFGSATKSIFGAKEYAAVLNQVIDRYRIETRFTHELVEIHPEKKEAVFERKDGAVGERVAIPYDMLHVVPPQRAPLFIRQSTLADREKPSEGWVKVDKFTLQHTEYHNVFALGDVAGTPNSKTGAAAVHQAPVVVGNLLALLNGREPAFQYGGYIACPIVTGYGRMLLAEVDYTGQPAPMTPWINTLQERYDMWLLKKYGLPWLYWHVFLRGRRLPFGPRAAQAEIAPGETPHQRHGDLSPATGARSGHR